MSQCCSHRKYATAFRCDLLCDWCMARTPANELLTQAGMRFGYRRRPLDARERRSRACPPRGAPPASSTWMPRSPAVRPVAGRRRPPPRLSRADTTGGSRVAREGLGHPGGPSPAAAGMPNGPANSFVCLCEDVTVKDIDQAVAEGFDRIETLKRYATVSMGPCQGKMCGATAIALCARATGQEFECRRQHDEPAPRRAGGVGRAGRGPPASSGPPHPDAPLARSRRRRWIDAGQWKRPESYGDPAAEVRAVRNGAGLIDVSTLGKIEVVGPDAAELLDRSLPEPVGQPRRRQGSLWRHVYRGRDRLRRRRRRPSSGRITFYLTATTGNAEAVFQWLELWRTTWRLNAMVRQPNVRLRGDEPGRAASARRARPADGARPVPRGLPLPALRRGRRCRRAMPAVADRLRRRAGL